MFFFAFISLVIQKMCLNEVCTHYIQKLVFSFFTLFSISCVSYPQGYCGDCQIKLLYCSVAHKVTDAQGNSLIECYNSQTCCRTFEVTSHKLFHHHSVILVLHLCQRRSDHSLNQLISTFQGFNWLLNLISQFSIVNCYVYSCQV